MAQMITSRSPRTGHTLLRQERLKELLRVQHDLERGQRIKELREQSHMTQPAIAERVGVTLRALQKWEEGGGLAWENLEALAELHHVTPQYIASGETPDLIATLGGDVSGDLQQQLDRIETAQHEMQEQLDQLLTYAQLAATERAEETAQRAAPKAPRKTRRAAS